MENINVSSIDIFFKDGHMESFSEIMDFDFGHITRIRTALCDVFIKDENISYMKINH